MTGRQQVVYVPPQDLAPNEGRGIELRLVARDTCTGSDAGGGTQDDGSRNNKLFIVSISRDDQGNYAMVIEPPTPENCPPINASTNKDEGAGCTGALEFPLAANLPQQIELTEVKSPVVLEPGEIRPLSAQAEDHDIAQLQCEDCEPKQVQICDAISYRWEILEGDGEFVFPANSKVAHGQTVLLKAGTQCEALVVQLSISNGCEYNPADCCDFVCLEWDRYVDDTVYEDIVPVLTTQENGYYVELKQIGDIEIEAQNNYSENATVLAKIGPTPPPGVTLYSARFEELGSVYDGLNGATDLQSQGGIVVPFDANGEAVITLKSVFQMVIWEGPDITPPVDAVVKVTVLDPGQAVICSSNEVRVSQWVDEDQDEMIDWLWASASDALACLTAAGVTNDDTILLHGLALTTGLEQYNDDDACGAATMGSGPPGEGTIALSPVCSGDSNKHRLNTSNEMINTVAHETHHRLQFWDVQRQEPLATDDDGDANTNPQNDDGDLYPELPFYRAVDPGMFLMADQAMTPWSDAPYLREGDSVSDAPRESASGYMYFEVEAHQFGDSHAADCD